jgi:hypothetical protein
LGREALGFVCEMNDEMRPFYRPEGGGGAVALINGGTKSKALPTGWFAARLWKLHRHCAPITPVAR